MQKPQVRWRQHTLPAVFLEPEDHKEKAFNVTWSQNLDSSHGTLTSYDTLEGNDKKYKFPVLIADTLTLFPR